MTTTTPLDPAYSAAFSVGWLIAQLYDHILETNETEPALPTVRELNRSHRFDLACEQIKSTLAGPLAPHLNSSAPPDPEGVKDAWDGKQTSVEATRKTISVFWIELLTQLTVNDNRLGSSLTLGRSLRDTCWIAPTKKELSDQFERHRIARLQSWLSDLTDVLPANAPAAVSRSLDNWSGWLDINRSRADQADPSIFASLKDQGDIWRALLAAEKAPASLLTPEGYVQAGEAALRRAGKILRRTIAHFWYLFVVLTVVAIGAGWLAIHYAAGTAKAWGAILSIASWVGITGTTLQSTVKRLAADTSKPIITLAEIDAIAVAATTLPKPQGWRPRPIKKYRMRARGSRHRGNSHDNNGPGCAWLGYPHGGSAAVRRAFATTPA